MDSTDKTMRSKKHLKGFTLIEVLLALAIIAIALTALLKATAQNIEHSTRIKEKTIAHWIALQGVTVIQLKLLAINQQGQESTQETKMLGERWYWRAKMSPAPIEKVQKITIFTSKNPSGPFVEELQAFRYLS